MSKCFQNDTVNCDAASNSSCCKEFREHDDFEGGSAAALLSIIPNVFLLLVFARRRAKDKVLPMGVIHFAILALLDIAFGLVDIVSDFPFKKVIGPNGLHCKSFTSFKISWETLKIVVLVMNRYFTAYITLKRLLVVAFPMRFRHIGVSERRHVRDALLSGVLTPLLLLSIIFLASRFVYDEDVDTDVRLDNIWLLLTFALSFVSVVVTMIAAGQLSYRRRSAQISTRADEETEWLVIWVAVSFTLLHIPFFVLFCEAYSNPECPIDGIRQNTAKVQDVAFSINSAANFFICLATSTAFRRAFFGVMRMVFRLGDSDSSSPSWYTDSPNFMKEPTRDLQFQQLPQQQQQQQQQLRQDDSSESSLKEPEQIQDSELKLLHPNGSTT